MLTKIRSLFLIRSAARGRKALRDAACPRTGRLASKHRAPPASSWCGFTGHRGARHLLGAIVYWEPSFTGSHRCTASDRNTGPSARARRARSCGGARAAVVHTPARRWYSSGFYSPVSGAVYSATGAHSVPWLRRRDCEHDRSVVAHCGGRHIARWDHSPILAYACIAVAFHHGSWMLAIRPLGFSDRRRAEKQR